MTLQPYSPETLDRFALRLLDVAATLRTMANICRENEMGGFALHDKKASEWCANLEQWAHKLRADQEIRLLQRRAELRGRKAAE